jgi:hypothetical protein
MVSTRMKAHALIINIQPPVVIVDAASAGGRVVA